jgi:hypothetical protein
MTHNTAWPVTALFPFDINNWYGLPAQGTAVDNWADDNFDHAGLDFLGGGNLWVYSDRRPIGAASMITFGRAPRWGSAWKSFIKQNADRWNVAYIQKTTLPYEDNYLDLDPMIKDSLGQPVCRITADFKDNEEGRGLHAGKDGAVVHGAESSRHHQARLDGCISPPPINTWKARKRLAKVSFLGSSRAEIRVNSLKFYVCVAVLRQPQKLTFTNPFRGSISWIWGDISKAYPELFATSLNGLAG